MTHEAECLTVSLAQALELPPKDREKAARLMTHGSMRLLYYAPKKADAQKPHAQDEIYVVASGEGTYFCNGRRVSFATGDVLFAPAGSEHRFEEFSDAFGTWVIFYGPEGGEH